MPLTPQAFFADLQAARAAAPFPMLGVQFDRLAMGIAVGVSTWAVSQPQNVALQGIATGASGAGLIPLGKLVVPPNPPLVIGALAGSGMVGPLGVSLGTIVGISIPRTFSTVGAYAGTAPGVGVGVDASKVVLSNAGTLIGILNGTLASFSGPGIALGMMTTGLGVGIAGCVALGFGAGSVVGVSGPSPAGTTTTSVVV